MFRVAMNTIFALPQGVNPGDILTAVSSTGATMTARTEAGETVKLAMQNIDTPFLYEVEDGEWVAVSDPRVLAWFRAQKEEHERTKPNWDSGVATHKQAFLDRATAILERYDPKETP